jgi:hypothetical protein
MAEDENRAGTRIDHCGDILRFLLQALLGHVFAAAASGGPWRRP